MHPDLHDILSHKDLPITSEQLVAYLTGQLSPADTHEVERKLAGAGLGTDALEGLSMLRNKHALPGIELALNEQLRQQLNEHKPKRRKAMVFQWPLMIALVVLVIALCIGVWFLVHFLAG